MGAGSLFIFGDMLWITLSLFSALFLGLYDITKKSALDSNAVWPVLFFCSFTGAVVFLPFLFLGKVPRISPMEHWLVILKALLVTGSWAFTFNAMARMPLSLTAPIRASAPLFTILMAVSFMDERPSVLQWSGILVSIASYVVMSFAGRKETGHFWSNVWILSMFFGTFLGAMSGVYDKFLLQRLHYPPLSLQFWFNVYMALIQGAFAMFFWYPRRARMPFHFRKAILFVGLLLVVADRLYFLALNEPDALVSVVTVIRRSNVVISFAGGILLFKERKTPLKAVAVSGIVIGLLLMALS